VHVRCGTGLSGAPRRQSSNGRNRQNPNGWVTWLVHQTVSSGAPDCTVRPSTYNLPNGWFGGWGYKYPPTTTTPSIQVFQTSNSIQELVQSIQDTIQKRVLLVFFELLFLDRFLLPHSCSQDTCNQSKRHQVVVVLVRGLSDPFD
jgi:hypothetical protein